MKSIYRDRNGIEISEGVYIKNVKHTDAAGILEKIELGEGNRHTMFEIRMSDGFKSRIYVPALLEGEEDRIVDLIEINNETV